MAFRNLKKASKFVCYIKVLQKNFKSFFWLFWEFKKKSKTWIFFVGLKSFWVTWLDFSLKNDFRRKSASKLIFFLNCLLILLKITRRLRTWSLVIPFSTKYYQVPNASERKFFKNFSGSNIRSWVRQNIQNRHF